MKVESALTILEPWFSANKLTFNIEKSNQSIFQQVLMLILMTTDSQHVFLAFGLTIIFESSIEKLTGKRSWYKIIKSPNRPQHGEKRFFLFLISPQY